VLRGRGEFNPAIQEFQRAIDLDPGNADAWRGLAAAYESSNRLDEAEATYLKAIDLRRDYWAGFSYLADFYTRRNRYLDAETMLKRVVELTPDNFIGYRSLGGVYLYQGDYANAIGALEKASGLRPSPATYSNLGVAQMAMGRYGDAVTSLEKALSMGAADYRVVGNLADAYRRSAGFAAKAPDAYRRAIQLGRDRLAVNPKDAGAVASVAEFRAKLGDSKGALQDIAKAAQLAPGDSEVVFKSAIVYELAGRRDMAAAKLEAALKAGYSPSEVRQNPELRDLRNDPRYSKFLQEEHAK
jgi:serine/threonine-protein kinase